MGWWPNTCWQGGLFWDLLIVWFQNATERLSALIRRVSVNLIPELAGCTTCSCHANSCSVNFLQGLKELAAVFTPTPPGTESSGWNKNMSLIHRYWLNIQVCLVLSISGNQSKFAVLPSLSSNWCSSIRGPDSAANVQVNSGWKAPA